MLFDLKILALSAIYIIIANFVSSTNYSSYKSSQFSECQFASNLDFINPCLNGICLINLTQPLGYQCYCFNGFTGINCTKNYDECLHQNPCQNKGNCVNDIPDVKCICAKGYCGKYCESEVNECLSNPCFNGARCVDKLNAYQCECLEGYVGERCEIDINVCNNETLIKENVTTLCANGGTCMEGPGFKYFCICPTGYTGQRCENKVKECDSHPCLNGGRCEEKVADFYCVCSFGWTGKTCNISLNECPENLCKNDGICMRVNDTKILNETNALLQNSILCYCLPDFHGLYCERRYNECDPNPCLNGGICNDGIDSFVCGCSLGFIGDLCETNCSDPICISPTTVFSDYMTYSPSQFAEVISSEMTSFYSSPSVFTIYPIYNISPSGIEFSNFDSFETQFLNSFTISDTFNSLPFISLSPTIAITSSSGFEINTSPTWIQNETMPTTFPTLEKIFIPRFNGLNSSLIYDSKETKKDSINIKLSFKIEKSEGTIFYSRGKGNLELLLYTENNILKFYLSKSKQKILYMESSFKINQNSFNEVDIKVGIKPQNKLFTNITINDTQIMTETKQLLSNHTYLCLDMLFLGELPTNNNIEISINETHLKGCIFDIFINKHEKLISDAINVSDISECNQFICSQNPCRNGGICKSVETSWRCECRKGYNGSLCQEAYCNQQVCQNGGVCILQNSRTFLCLCTYGTYGKYCEHLKTNPTHALFNSKGNNSFIKYKLENLTNHLEIRFRFATLNIYQTKALLLFMGHIKKYKNNKILIDFMSISLEFGYLFFRINLGHGIESLSTPINPNVTEQMVLFGHHKQFVWLIVIPPENEPIKPITGKTPLSFKALNVSPYLYVGGHENFRGHPFLHSLTGFKGCIYDIEIRTKQDVHFKHLRDDSIERAVDIGECDIVNDCNIK